MTLRLLKECIVLNSALESRGFMTQRHKADSQQS